MSNWIVFGGTGTGNWSDANHWSAGVPDSTHDAIFNASSFNGAGQVVTVDVAANCLNMDWTGATNTPTLAGSFILNFYGALTFINAMVYTHTGELSAKGTSTLTSNGLSLTTTADIVANFATSLTILDNLNIGTKFLYTNESILVFASGITVTCGGFNPNNVAASILTMNSAIINCTSMTVGAGAFTVTANTATINISGTGALAARNANYNGATFNLNGTAHTVTGTPTRIAAFNFNPAAAQTITATGATITAASVSRTGTGTITIVNGTFVKTGGGHLNRRIFHNGGNIVDSLLIYPICPPGMMSTNKGSQVIGGYNA
jgi:hypothetical protein